MHYLYVALFVFFLSKNTNAQKTVFVVKNSFNQPIQNVALSLEKLNQYYLTNKGGIAILKITNVQIKISYIGYNDTVIVVLNNNLDTIFIELTKRYENEEEVIIKSKRIVNFIEIKNTNLKTKDSYFSIPKCQFITVTELTLKNSFYSIKEITFNVLNYKDFLLNKIVGEFRIYYISNINDEIIEAHQEPILFALSTLKKNNTLKIPKPRLIDFTEIKKIVYVLIIPQVLEKSIILKMQHAKNNNSNCISNFNSTNSSILENVKIIESKNCYFTKFSTDLIPIKQNFLKLKLTLNKYE